MPRRCSRLPVRRGGRSDQTSLGQIEMAGSRLVDAAAAADLPQSLGEGFEDGTGRIFTEQTRHHLPHLRQIAVALGQKRHLADKGLEVLKDRLLFPQRPRPAVGEAIVVAAGFRYLNRLALPMRSVDQGLQMLRLVQNLFCQGRGLVGGSATSLAIITEGGRRSLARILSHVPRPLQQLQRDDGLDFW